MYNTFDDRSDFYCKLRNYFFYISFLSLPRDEVINYQSNDIDSGERNRIFSYIITQDSALITATTTPSELNSACAFAGLDCRLSCDLGRTRISHKLNAMR